MRVFNVHHLIADVIGSLYKIHQRVPYVFHGLSLFGNFDNTHLLGYSLIIFLFAEEEAKLPFLFCKHR